MTYTLITGATGGLGSAFAEELIKSENLFLTGRSAEKLYALKERLRKINGEAEILTYPCDFTDIMDRNALYKYIEDNDLTFNGLINVMGQDIQKGFTRYTEEKIVSQVRVNLEGTLSITRKVIERKAEGLKILTVSSMSGVSPMPYFAIYSATKSALLSFFTSLHYELKKDGVKVTTVLPGGIYTRPDIVQDIKGQGLWGKLSAKTPRYVAVKSLKAISKNKVKYIPGFFNKFLYCVMKIAPKRVVIKFIYKRWKKQEKDAF